MYVCVCVCVCVARGAARTVLMSLFVCKKRAVLSRREGMKAVKQGKIRPVVGSRDGGVALRSSLFSLATTQKWWWISPQNQFFLPFDYPVYPIERNLTGAKERDERDERVVRTYKIYIHSMSLNQNVRDFSSPLFFSSSSAKKKQLQTRLKNLMQ